MKAIILICAFAVAGLAACAESTDGTEPATQPVATPAAQPAAAEAPPSDAQPGRVPGSGQGGAGVPGSGQGPAIVPGSGQGGGGGGGGGPSTVQEVPTPPSGPNTVTVILPNQRNLQWMNFWIALGAGYFSDEGLEVHPISPPRPDRAGRFLVMGRGDVAILPGPKQIELIAAEEPIAIFANLLANDPLNLILRKGSGRTAQRLAHGPSEGEARKPEGTQGRRCPRAGHQA